MKKILWMLLTSCVLLFGALTNKTAEPMLCYALYPAEFKEEELYGILQRVQVKKEESVVALLQPGETFERQGKGFIRCYNEHEKIESRDAQWVTTTNEHTLAAHLNNHEMFDFSSYVNQDRAYVDKRFGISQQCFPYKEGEYCKKGNGLDIYFDAEGRVSRLFIYGAVLQNGRLPFEPESLHKLTPNGEPLGLWVSKKNRELISGAPTLRTDSVIYWANPTPSITSVVMTPQNGYLNQRWSRPRGEKAAPLQDHLQSVEITYAIDKAAKRDEEKKAGIKTWGAHLNPSGKVPKNRFKAFYINTKEPNKVIASEVVEKVSINYPWADFHGIKSEDFGGYWVGDFHYDKETPQEISLELSWAKARVIINGKVVYEGGNTTTFPHTFKKGSNKIEVEYINNWHTTGFKMTVKAKEEKYGTEALRKKLKEVLSDEAQLLFAGVYESKRNDQSITLKLVKQDKPVAIVLSSYSGVNWIIKNPHKVKIEAVVYSAYNPGTELSGDLPGSVPVLAYDGRVGSYTMEKKCSCHGAMFHCDGNDGLSTLEQIESIFQKNILGYSGQYSTDVLLLPNTLVTEKLIKKLEDTRLEIENQRKACNKETNPEFDKVFDR